MPYCFARVGSMNLVVLLGRLLVQRGQPRWTERGLTLFSLRLRCANASRSREQVIDQSQHISRKSGEESVHGYSDFRLNGKYDFSLSSLTCLHNAACGTRGAD